jgi:hypothetical protein
LGYCDTDNSKVIVLLEGCKKNHRSSQKKTYFLLYKFALDFCGKYDISVDVRDVINEAFLNLFVNINRFNEQGQSDILLGLQIWFEKILRQVCVKYASKKTDMVPSLYIMNQNGNYENRYRR